MPKTLARSASAERMTIPPHRVLPVVGIVIAALLTTLAAAAPALAARASSVRARTSASTSGGNPGFVYGWGEEYNGNLEEAGCGKASSAHAVATPVAIPMPGNTPVTSVQAGNNFAFSVTADGHGYAWGAVAGQLDDQLDLPASALTGNNACAPSEMQGFSGNLSGTFTSLTPVGLDDSMLQSAEGTGYSAGFENNSGAGGAAFFASNTDNLSSTPAPDLLPSGATDMASSTNGTVSYAVTASGQVVAAGDGAYGDLGPNATSSGKGYDAAVPLPSGETATQVAAGYEFGLALTSDGKVYGWGSDASGQLGDGQQQASSGVVQIPFPQGVQIVQIAAGNGLLRSQSTGAPPGFGLALSSTGAVYAWGDDSDAEQGDGTTGSTPETPHVIGGLPVLTQIAAGSGFGLALTPGGTLYSWGSSTYGALGNGAGAGNPGQTEQQLSPGLVTFPAGDTVQSVSANGGNTIYAVVQPGVPVVGAGATDVLGETATFDGSVFAPRAITVSGTPTCAFVYGTDSTLTSGTVTVSASCASIASNAVNDFSASNSAPLALSTKYYLEAQVTIDGQLYTSPITSFTTTNGIDLSATAATSVGPTSAQLNGSATIEPAVNATSATCAFVYSTSASIPQGAPTITAPCSTSGSATLTAQASGLLSDTTYYYEVEATVDGNDYTSSAEDFTTTIPTPTTVTTGSAGSVSSSSATLSGTVTFPSGPDFASTQCGVEISEDPTLSSGAVTVQDTTGACQSPSGSVAISATASNLSANTTYFYRAYAVTRYAGATPTYGSIESFQTSPAAGSPPGSGGGTGAVSPPPSGTSTAPSTGPNGAGPAPGTANTSALSPTTCTNTTEIIGAVGGAFQVTGCIYGDNDGHFLVQGSSPSTD